MSAPGTRAQDLAKGDRVKRFDGVIQVVRSVRTYTDVTVVWWVGDKRPTTYHKDQASGKVA